MAFDECFLVLVYLPLLTAVVVLVVVCGLEGILTFLIRELKIVLRLNACYLIELNC